MGLGGSPPETAAGSETTHPHLEWRQSQLLGWGFASLGYASRRCKADNHPHPRCEQLLRNQYRVRSADGAWDDTTGFAVYLKRKHRGVETRPILPRRDGLGLHKMVGEIT